MRNVRRPAMATQIQILLDLILQLLEVLQVISRLFGIDFSANSD